MRGLKQYISAISILSIGFQPLVYAESENYAIALNKYLQEHVAETGLTTAGTSFEDFVNKASPYLDEAKKEALVKQLGPVMKEKLPEFTVSAHPWVRYMFKDKERWYTLSFVGTERSFMTLNGQNITWEQARQIESLSARISEIIKEQVEGEPAKVSLLSVFFPMAHAYAPQQESWAQQNSSLIWGGALIIAAATIGYFGYKSAKSLSKAKTTHTVKVDGIPEKIKTESTVNVKGIPEKIKTENTVKIDGIPDTIKTKNDVNVGVDGIPGKIDINANGGFELSLNQHLKRLVGSTAAPPKPQAKPSGGQRSPAEALQ